jgi:pimeloyl-ACP methyl ester carboxylesterase
VKPNLNYYTLDQLVHELEILRRMVVTTPRVRLLAHGFGGVLAQHYALSYPEQVESMILLSSLPAEGAQYGSVLEYYDDLFRTVARAGIPPVDPNAADEWYARYNYQSAVALLGDPSHAHLLPELHGSFGSARALNASLASAVRPHRLSRARLTPRTLLVYGQEEAPCGTGAGLAPMILRFSNASLVTIPDAGYWAFLEDPIFVRSVISGFLRTSAP